MHTKRDVTGRAGLVSTKKAGEVRGLKEDNEADMIKVHYICVYLKL